MNRERLAGTWRLVSCEVWSAGGGVSHPWGRSPLGYLIYGNDGYMSVTAMSADRARPREQAADAGAFSAYAGRYEVQDRTVTHHIDVAVHAAWVGTSQIRTLEIDGPRLLLTTPEVLDEGVQKIARLVWERVCGQRGDVIAPVGGDSP